MAGTDFRRKIQALPAPLKVHLSEEEDRQLLEFQKIDGIPARVRERAEMVRLNYYGWSVEAVGEAAPPASAKYKNKSPHTVRASLKRWSNQGFLGLWERIGRGRKRKWREVDLKFIESCLEKDQRTNLLNKSG